MAQHDYSIADQNGASFRSDLNSALSAIVSNNSGATEPATTYAYQWWADTTAGILKRRNAANDAWISVMSLTQGLIVGVNIQAYDSTLETGATKTSRKNYIINGNLNINQRGVSGTVVLAAGEYGHDRFKAGASGCTYTFATSNNVTTLTITAGSLVQVVEGLSLASGTYTLSWTGTAQGKIGAGSYSSSGVTGSITGGTDTNIEFNTGTLSLVQLEKGSISTEFEYRPIAEELDLCKRYYKTFVSSWYISGFANSATQARCSFNFTEMRTAPTISSVNPAEFDVIYGTNITVAASSVAALVASKTSAVIDAAVTGLTVGAGIMIRIPASPAAGTALILDAEL